jgi:membrane-associated phospholipid phosphatase
MKRNGVPRQDRRIRNNATPLTQRSGAFPCSATAEQLLCVVRTVGFEGRRLRPACSMRKARPMHARSRRFMTRAALLGASAGFAFVPCVARGQAPPASATPASPTTPGSSVPPVPSPIASPKSSGGSIAPPGPNAHPVTVAKARDTAKVTELTPILTHPTAVLRPAFQLYMEVDLPVLGIGAVMATARFVRGQKAFCAPECDPADLNPFDRTTAGFWSPAWSTASDVGLYSLLGGAAAVLVIDEGVVDALNDSVVITESALTGTAVASIMTLAAGRPRPFLFGTSAPLDVRNGPDASLSFVSSHTTVSFALTTSTFMAMRRLHPTSPGPWILLGVGIAASAFVGAARVMGGNHFMTDVFAGAIVGSSVGVLIPALHTSPVKVVPIVSETQRGLGVGGSF